jgi:hypothetical protein
MIQKEMSALGPRLRNQAAVDAAPLCHQGESSEEARSPHPRAFTHAPLNRLKTATGVTCQIRVLLEDVHQRSLNRGLVDVLRRQHDRVALERVP